MGLRDLVIQSDEDAPKLSAYDIERVAQELWESVPEQPPRMKYVYLQSEGPLEDGGYTTDADGNRWQFGGWLPVMEIPPWTWVTIATEVSDD